MDAITLREIVAYGRHGANPGERDREQPFAVDVTMHVERFATGDTLSDTVDYARVHREIVAVVENESFVLIETLAEAIARIALSDQRVVDAEVTVAKPRLLDGATPSVTIRRDRAWR